MKKLSLGSVLTILNSTVNNINTVITTVNSAVNLFGAIKGLKTIRNNSRSTDKKE